MILEDTISRATLRPTQVTVDLDIITSNFKSIEEFSDGSKVMYILKANAYGHGLITVARHLQDLGASYLGVAYLEEGILLRESGITCPVLVLGGIIGDQLPAFIEHDLTITASSIEKLEHIEKAAIALGRKARAHLKIDTGMERIGMHYYSAARLLEAADQCQHVDIEGIYTHLANADEGDQSYTRLQLERFSDVLAYYEGAPTKPMVHIANSGGMLQIDDYPWDMLRVGLLLYGVYPSDHLRKYIQVTPAMRWTTRVVYFKVVLPDHPVSYGSTWKSEVQTRIITLPVGYGDGYMRAMSNKAKVIVRGTTYDQVGHICMDQMMVDIGDGTAYNGDEVVLLGQQGDSLITIEDMASWADTIPYEILTNINTRVPRVYISKSDEYLS